MPVTIDFELSDSDIEHFVAMAREAHEGMAGREGAAEEIVASTRAVFEAAQKAKLPEYVAVRLNKLGVLADMVTDGEWQLPEEELTRVLSALAYFSNPEDLIPDRVPGIGFLDDAIMAELVVTNLEPEITAYQEFCAYRTAEENRRANRGLPTDVSRDDWLAEKRAALHRRMRRQRSSGRSGWKASLW